MNIKILRAKMNKKDLTFEQAVTEIETIIKNIEINELDLESSLNNYKNGMELIKFCQEKLQNIEQKIKIFDQENNQLQDINLE